MGTEAVHRALVRFAQGELGKDVGTPNDVGFENFDWPTVAQVRRSSRASASATDSESSTPGSFYEYPGDPLADRRRHPRKPHTAGLIRFTASAPPGSSGREAPCHPGRMPDVTSNHHA